MIIVIRVITRVIIGVIIRIRVIIRVEIRVRVRNTNYIPTPLKHLVTLQTSLHPLNLIVLTVRVDKYIP